MRRAILTVGIAALVYTVAILVFLKKEAVSWSFIEWLAVVGFPLTWLGLYLAWQHVGEIRAAVQLSSVAAHGAEQAATNTLEGVEAAKEASEASKEAATTAREGADAARAAAEKARDAAGAARDAIGRTETKLADQNTLLLIAQVQNVLNDFDRADDGQLVGLASEWIDVAGQLEGILKAAGNYEKLAVALASSVDVAGAMKEAIIVRKEHPQMAARPLRAELTVVRAALSRIMGPMRAYIGEPPRG